MLDYLKEKVPDQIRDARTYSHANSPAHFSPYTYTHMRTLSLTQTMLGYEVSTISRLLKIAGLFCRISSFL